MTEKLHRSYSMEKTKGADGVTTSGSFSFWEDAPVSPLDIGDEFQPVPGGPKLRVGKVSISDSVIGERFGRPFRQWQITVEGDSSVASGDENARVKYTFSIDKQESGVISRSGTMEVTNDGASPAITIAIGGTFTVPGIGEVVCTKTSGGDSITTGGVRRWTVTYEGAKTDAGGPTTMPETTETVTFELNGVTARSVAGELIALRRSTTPITKKSTTICNDSSARLTTPGNAYSGGIAMSERVAKETVKVNGVQVGAYYRHEIEVES